jgi:hypothetical protein
VFDAGDPSHASIMVHDTGSEEISPSPRDPHGPTLTDNTVTSEILPICLLGPVQQLRFQNRRFLKSGDFETGNANIGGGTRVTASSRKAKAYRASSPSKKEHKKWVTPLVVATAAAVTTHHMALAVPH